MSLGVVFMVLSDRVEIEKGISRFSCCLRLISEGHIPELRYYLLKSLMPFSV